MANTKQSCYVAVATGINFKFSGTKTIYTSAMNTLLGISTTASESAVYGVGTVLCAPSKLEEALAGLRSQT